MKWSLYNKDKYLKPLIYSNGKSQLDVVEETLEAIKEGHKVIFIRGICGTGKSSIALNIAKEVGKTSIVVPVKPLQKQYEEDYTDKLSVLKDNKEKLKISVIDGRNNHKCPFKGDCMADDRTLPCTIELKKENMKIIDEYLDQNPFVNIKNFKGIKDVRRKSIAPACPYWSPLMCKAWFENEYSIEDSKEIDYKGLNNKTFTYFKRKPGCGYCDQFKNYIDSDVIIFNSKKYELENLMDRKPLTEVEIIDECDEFLDSLSNERKINLDRLSRTLSSVKIDDLELKEVGIEINELVLSLLKNKENLNKDQIFLIKDTKVLKLLKSFLSNPGLTDLGEDETSDYIYSIYQTGKVFESFFDETYVTFDKNDYGDLVVNLITINLEKKLKEFFDKNKVFVMMSGTIHSESVLKNIFGIENFKIIEAEGNHQGNISKVGTGLERNFNYEMLRMKGAREAYLKALSTSIEQAEKPVLVHVNAYADLPTEDECLMYGITNLKSRQDLKNEQNEFKRGELIQNFKKGETDILYSTKCTRGVDFPGEMCNSIVFTKYPYPNINSLFWKILRKSKPQYFGLFYKDKSRREFYQRIYRGLRSDDDHINLLSPDSRVFNGF